MGFTAVADLVTVKYFEAMLANPLNFAQTICTELGVDMEANRVGIEYWANRVQNTNNRHFIEAKTSRNYSRPDHKTRIDRWKENLSTAEIQQVWPIIAITAQNFGYSLPALNNQ